MIAVERGRRGHLRLVHPIRPLLSVEHLRHFLTPRTWAEIRELEPRMSMAKWRAGILDADEYGCGCLMWIRAKPLVGERRSRRGAWVLTDKGRAYVEARS